MVTYRPLLRLLTAISALLSFAAAGKTQAVIGVNFMGNTLAEGQTLNGFTYAPPDTDGAVGLNHYVQFTNGTFSVYNKSDGSLVTPKISDSTFWVNAGIGGTSMSDPRILFDPRSQRWFAVEINTGGTGNSVFVARSNTADPTQGFKGGTYGANAGFIDFPTLGVNADGIFIGSNNFTSSTGTFTGVSITSIPKADLLLATPTLANRTTREDTTANLGQTLQGATDFGPSNGHGSILAVNNSSFGQLNRTNIFNVAGPGAATFGPTTVINVGATSLPGLGHQPDGTQTLDNGDDRIGATVYKMGNLLYAVHSTQVGSYTAIRWNILDDTTNALLQEGTLSDPLFDYSYPSIAVNANGQVVIGFSRSGGAATLAAGNLSAYAVAGTTSTGGTLNFGAPFLLKAGESGGYHLANRWGDYSATSADPADPNSFWTTQEYAGPGGSDWRTQVTQIRFLSAATPEPGSFALLAALGISGSILLKRRRK